MNQLRANKEVSVKGKRITLVDLGEARNSGRSYYTWAGKYKVECESEVTQSDVIEMVGQGIFGFGQVCNARINDGVITYNGECDSSG